MRIKPTGAKDTYIVEIGSEIRVIICFGSLDIDLFNESDGWRGKEKITGSEVGQEYYNLSSGILKGAIGDSLKTWSVIS
jgi:hypothetical protein